MAKLVCTAVPPVRAVYHRNVPPPGAAVLAASVTVPVPQILPAVAVGAAGKAFTVAFTSVRGVLSHPAALAKVT